MGIPYSEVLTASGAWSEKLWKSCSAALSHYQEPHAKMEVPKNSRFCH